MITWGIVANSHDASIAVAQTKTVGLGTKKKTKILWAGLAKDFSGVPNDPHLNEDIIQHAMNNYGHADRIVWYERPRLKTLRQLWAGQGWLWRENNIKRYLEGHHLYNIPISYVQHHKSHAAYAYYTQPHDDCAVICLDSIGEFETLTIWHGRNGNLKKIHSQWYPDSLGLFYSAMTQRLGLVPQRDEYLVSQWADKGDASRFTDLLDSEIIDHDMKSELPAYIRMRENLHRGCMWWRPEIESQQDLYDLAAATQYVFERSVKYLARWASINTRSRNIAFAGGGAMNKRAVTLATLYYDSVWVPPNPGDPGSCIGAILAHNKQRIDNIDKVWNR